jgi:hypothetical protein
LIWSSSQHQMLKWRVQHISSRRIFISGIRFLCLFRNSCVLTKTRVLEAKQERA